MDGGRRDTSVPRAPREQAHRARGPAAPVPRPVRVLLGAFCVLTAAGTASLLVGADRTAELFAWTIDPPLTAAFLGAGYGAGLVLSLLALRSRTWAEVDVPFVTVLVFTWFTTLATLLHRDRLHLVAPGIGPVAEPAAWVWVVVYVVVPVAMAVVLVRVGRPRRAPPAVPVPRWLTAALLVEGGLLGAAGVALWVAPTGWWPWALTPFTARAVGSWLLAFGVASVLAARVADLGRLRVATVAYTVFGLLQLLAVGLHAEDVADGAGAAAWVVLLVAVTLTGLAGRLLGRRRADLPGTTGDVGPRSR